MEKTKFNIEIFGDLIPFINDKNVTDIRWDGQRLWIDDLTKGKYASDIKLSKEFLNIFIVKLSDYANVHFNKSMPSLEAETDNLRITAIHESVTATGLSLTIRKTEPERRLTNEKMISSNYCNQTIIDLLKSLVEARTSIIVTGDTGSGKTELVKYLTQYIRKELTTITIEDNYEIRCRAINPELDCVEIKVGDNFTYSEAIKKSLRQNAKYLLLSEARSREVKYLLEAASTGCSVMTTIHSNDVRNIPDRIVNMLADEGEEKRNDVFAFFDVGIHVDKTEDENGITRRISQICLYERSYENEDENEIIMLYNDGEFTGNQLPEHLKKRMRNNKVQIPTLPKGGINV